jgi:phosphopentomutase
LSNHFDGFSGQGFEIAGRRILFAELDVIDAGAGSFSDLLQKMMTTSGFVSGESGAVGDVVEKAAGRHHVKN